MNEREIFQAAIEIENPEEQRQYLDQVCQDQPELRGRLDVLLRHFDDAGSFLERPPAEFDQTRLLDNDEVHTGLAGDTSSESLLLSFLTPSEKPGVLGTLGQYEVLEVIGRGGMGVVLKAEDTKLHRIVAIKLLAPEWASNPMARKRFLREAQAAAAVTHDHVVRIYAVNDSLKLPMLVMEYIDGQSLQQKIDRSGALGTKEILRIGLQAALGLAAAHKQGLVHRDIKPANILLENGIERVKITDFGLARAVDDVGMTNTGQITGTPQYMSPEQALGDPVDHRSDLFSLGSVLYAMCTGRSAFRAESTMAVLRRVCDDHPRPIPEINPEVPAWLVDIVEQLMEKNPDRRFQSAEEVAELLGRHLAHLQQPTVAPRPDPLPMMRNENQKSALWWDQLSNGWSPANRHKWAARAALVAALLAGVAWLLIADFHERDTLPDWLGQFDSLEGETVGKGASRLIVDVRNPLIESIRISSGKAKSSTFSPGRTGWRTLQLAVPPGEYFIEALINEHPIYPRKSVNIAPGERHVVTIGADAAAGDDLTLVRKFEGHTGPVKCVAYSPDGTLIASASGLNDGDQTARIWNVASGRLLHTLKHPDQVMSVCFSPDGRHVLTGSVDGRPRLWDATGGQLVSEYSGNDRWIDDVAFSADGRLVLACSGRTVSVWNTQTGEKIHALGKGDVPFRRVAVTPDGQRVVAANRDAQVVVWNLASGEFERTYPETAPEKISGCGMTLVADGKHAVVGNAEGVLRLWELSTGRLIRSINLRFVIQEVDVTPDGRYCLASGGSGSDKSADLALVDLETGRTLLTQDSPAGVIWSVAVSPNGREFVTASGSAWRDGKFENTGDYSLRLWRLPEDVVGPAESDNPPGGLTEVRRFGSLHTRPLSDVAVVPSADGRLIASSSYDGTVRFWDVATGREARPLLDHGKLNPRSLAVSPDGKTIAVGDHTGQVHLWDRENGVRRRTLTLAKGYVDDLAFSTDGALLYVGMAHYPEKKTGAVVVYDTASWERLRELEDIDTGVNQLVPFSQDRRVLVCTDGRRGGVWDPDTSRRLTRFHDLPTSLHALAISPDGTLAALGFAVPTRRDGRFEDTARTGIWLCDVESGRLVRELHGHTSFMNDLAWTADGRFLISGSGGHHTGAGFVRSWDNTLRVWNIETGAEVARAEIDTEWGVWSLALLPDGRHVVTAGSDGPQPDLRLWKLPESVWPVSEEQWIELLPLIDPKQDAVKGDWTRDVADLVVQAAKKQHSVIETPYQPPAEYDVLVELTRLSGKYDISLNLSRGDEVFGVNFAQSNRNFGVSRVNGGNQWANRPDLALVNGRRYVAKVEVRKNRITGFLDEEKIFSVDTTGTKLTRFEGVKQRKELLLGLTVWEVGARFHRVAVREVTGRGRLATASNRSLP